MKKLLFILLFIPIIGFSQEKSTDTISSLEITEAERIIDKYSGKIANSFNEGINKITPMAEEGFEIAVKLQLAKGIAYMIPSLLFIIFIMLFIKEYNDIKKELSSENIPIYLNENCGPFDEGNINPKLIIYLALSVILFIIAALSIYDGITHIVAPEWYAIKEIIELF